MWFCFVFPKSFKTSFGFYPQSSFFIIFFFFCWCGMWRRPDKCTDVCLVCTLAFLVFAMLIVLGVAREWFRRLLGSCWSSVSFRVQVMTALMQLEHFVQSLRSVAEIRRYCFSQSNLKEFLLFDWSKLVGCFAIFCCYFTNTPFSPGRNCHLSQGMKSFSNFFFVFSFCMLKN